MICFEIVSWYSGIIAHTDVRIVYSSTSSAHLQRYQEIERSILVVFCCGRTVICVLACALRVLQYFEAAHRYM